MILNKHKNLLSIVNSLIQLISTLISGVLIVRLWGTEIRGEIYYFTQLGNTAALFFSFGLGPALLLSFKKSILKIEHINYVLNRYSFLLLILIPFVLTLFVISGNDSLGIKKFWILLNLFFFIYFNVINIILSVVLMVTDNGTISSLNASIIGNLIFFLLVLFFTLNIDPSSIILMCALNISVFFKFIMLICEQRKYSKLQIKVPKSLLITLVKDSSFLFINNFLLVNILRVDTFLLKYFNNSEAVGRYSIAVNLSELVLLIPSALGVILFPSLINSHKDMQVLLAAKYSRINVFTSFLVSLIVLILSPFILEFIYGIKTLDVLHSILLLLPGLILFSIVYSLSNYIGAIGIPQHATFIYFIGLLVNVTLNYFLIQRFAIVGAAFASFISYIFIGFSFAIYLKITKSYISFFDLVILKRGDVSLFIKYIKSIFKK